LIDDDTVGESDKKALGVERGLPEKKFDFHCPPYLEKSAKPYLKNGESCHPVMWACKEISLQQRPVAAASG